MTTNDNRFAKLPIDESSPSREGPPVMTTHGQRAQAARKDAPANESATPAQDTATANNNVASNTDEKPKEKGWEASMTMAQLKAYKAEEALKAHNKRFPPKPKQDPTPTNTKQAPAKTKTPGLTDGVHAGLKNVTTGGGNARWANVARTETDNYKPIPVAPQTWVSGCGIEGCRVKAEHERREYAVKDPGRPNLIKKIQAKFGPDENELKTLTHFFDLHKRDAEMRKQHGE